MEKQQFLSTYKGIMLQMLAVYFAGIIVLCGICHILSEIYPAQESFFFV